MPNIDIEISNFTVRTLLTYPSQTTNNSVTHPLKITRPKLIKFAQTVGLSRIAKKGRGNATTLAMATYRAMTVKACFDFSGPNLAIHPAYFNLESTEKANLAYWIGMAMAGFFAADVLDVPRLVHASQRKHVQVRNKKNKSLADLVGRDRNQHWHVVEAKARTKNPSVKESKKWKAQANTISTINHQAIRTGSYSACILANPCTGMLVDPPLSGPNWNVDERRFGEYYYHPMVDFLKSGPLTIRGLGKNRAVLRRIAVDAETGEDVWIGMDSDVWGAVSSGGSPPFSISSDDHDEHYYIGSDGIVVALGSAFQQDGEKGVRELEPKGWEPSDAWRTADMFRTGHDVPLYPQGETTLKNVTHTPI